MCMLLGFSGDRKYRLTSLLRKFFENGHTQPHGWGMAIYGADEQSDEPFVAKEPSPAHESAYLGALLEKGVVARMAIAHVRLASKGSVSIANTHPFVKRANGTDWVLAHNGTLPDYAFRWDLSVSGGTDSEKILAEIVRFVGKDSGPARIKRVEAALETMSPYGKLNLIFTDGEKMYVFSNRENTLFSVNVYGSVIIATEPVAIKSPDGEFEWNPVPLRTLLVYKNGKLEWSGKQVGDFKRLWKPHFEWEEIEGLARW